MKRLLLLLLPLAARAQTPPAGRPARSFIPAGYRELPDGRATGDLNRDGRPDLALVLGPIAEDSLATAADENEASLPPRRLLVLLAAPGGGYRLAAESRQAVLCRGCGGNYGDPFVDISIRKGVLMLNHYGGSIWRWTITARFRRQPDGRFYVIGETYNAGYSAQGDCPDLDGLPGNDYRDTNYLTGAYEVRRISESCKLLEHRRGRHPVRPLQPLAAYEPAP